MLLSEEYIPLYNVNGHVQGFIIRNPWDMSVRVLADKDQFAYIDSGKYDYISGIGPAWAKNYVPDQARTEKITFGSRVQSPGQTEWAM